MSHVILYVRAPGSCPRCGQHRYRLTTGGSEGMYGNLFHMRRCSVRITRRQNELLKDCGLKPHRIPIRQTKRGRGK